MLRCVIFLIAHGHNGSNPEGFIASQLLKVQGSPTAAVPTTPPAREPLAPQPARTIKRKAVNYSLLQNYNSNAKLPAPIASSSSTTTATAALPSTELPEVCPPLRPPTPTPADVRQAGIDPTSGSGVYASPSTPKSTYSRRGVRSFRKASDDVIDEQSWGVSASPSMGSFEMSPKSRRVSRSASIHSNLSSMTQGIQKKFHKLTKSKTSATSSGREYPAASSGVDMPFFSPGTDLLPDDKECGGQLAALSEQLERVREECREWKRRSCRAEHEKIKSIAELSANLRSVEESYKCDVESIKAAHIEKCDEMLHSISELLIVNDSFRQQLESHGIEPATVSSNALPECKLNIDEHKIFLERVQHSIERQVTGGQRQLEDMLTSIEATTEAIVGEFSALLQYLPPDYPIEAT